MKTSLWPSPGLRRLRRRRVQLRLLKLLSGFHFVGDHIVKCIYLLLFSTFAVRASPGDL